MEDAESLCRRGHHLFVYQKTLNLSDSIAKCKEDGRTRYLHVYADKIVLNNSSTINVADTRLRTIHIFTRDFSTDDVSRANLDIVCGDGAFRIFLYCEEALPNLQLTYHHGSQAVAKPTLELLPANAACPRLLQGEECPNLHSRLRAEDVGREIVFSGDGIRFRSLRSVSQLELAGPSYEDTRAFGDIFQASSKHTNSRGFLSALLEDMFVTVSIDIMSNDAGFEARDLVSISRLRFIIRCLGLDPSSTRFTADAKRLLDRLQLARSVPRAKGCTGRPFFVPVLEPDYISKKLRARIANAKTTEQNIAIIEAARRNRTESRVSTNAVIEAIAKTMSSLADENVSRENAIGAIAEMARKRNDLVAAADAVKAQKVKMEKELEDYEKRQKAKAFWAMLALVGQVVVSVGISVATCGTGSVLTTVNAFEALQKAKELSAGAKVLAALKKLVMQCDKIWAKIQAADKSQKTYSTTAGQLDADKTAADGLQKVAERITADSLPNDALAPIDFLGLMADWDEVDVSTNEVFDGIKEVLDSGESFPELGRFKSVMLNQAIRGRTVIKAMAAAQTAAQLYWRQLAERQARDAVAKKIKALETHEKDEADGFAEHYFQRALSDLKRAVFVVFHECILSLMYFHNMDGIPQEFANSEKEKRLTADMPIADSSKSRTFEDLFAELENIVPDAMADDRGQTLPSSVIVDTTTHLGTVFDENWKSLLVDNNQITFQVPTDIEAVYEFRRVRIIKLRATFEGLDGADKVRYYFTLGPRNIDITSSALVQSYTPPFSLVKVGAGGDPLDQKGVLMRPALFCDVTLGFNPANNKGIDLSTISKIIITFDCVATLKHV
ncbi:hypothetical protein B0T10DRAFT_548753 [Thelonectria olida]|uniref:Uncharacterized protein n=1 Tax=Thelonectria olida TaxID=1576542 RepID=A0A9P9AQ84_9HYPO|nr:hypothetical protein B0T10DRAFT_548753 [Thelonectria olida]